MQKKAKHKTNKKQNNYNIKKEEGYLVVVIKKSKRLTSLCTQYGTCTVQGTTRYNTGYWYLYLVLIIFI